MDLLDEQPTKSTVTKSGIEMELEGSKICHPKICFVGIRIILGWLFLRNSRFGRNSENEEVTLCKRHLHIKGKSPLVSLSLSVVRREG